MYALYDFLLGVAALAVVPVLALPRLRAHRERLGTYAAEVAWRLEDRGVLWLHSASIGEVLASRPLLRRFHDALPDWRIVLSTTTLTGRELARGLPEADAAILLPFDLRRCVARALDTLRPSLFVFTETEIWPNLLRGLAGRGVPAIMLSGRVSPRAFRRYRWIRGFLRRVLANVALFGMQSEEEAERIRALGAPPDRVRVTGNLKLDAPVPVTGFDIASPGDVWVAASTHAGEEAVCLRVWSRLRSRFPGLRLLLAPRHLDRVENVEELLRSSGTAYTRRTTSPGGCWDVLPPVLLLDTLGELAGLYRGTVAAFVGGTLVPVGGHNLLEPARAEVPVLFGPHVDNVAALARALEEGGGGIRVRDEADLEAQLAELLADPERARRMGAAALRESSGSGSVEASFRAAEPFFSLGGGDR